MAAVSDFRKGTIVQAPLSFGNPTNSKANTPFVTRKITLDEKAVLMGFGADASPVTVLTADKHFFQCYTKSTATSGDNRGMYWKHRLSGAGTGTGECIRAWTDVTAACAGAFGAHITASITGAGITGVSGLMAGARATLGADAQTRTISGTVAALQVDSDLATGNTLPAGAAFIRVADNGAVKITNLFSIAAGNSVLGANATVGSAYKFINVYVEGVGVKKLLLYDVS